MTRPDPSHTRSPALRPTLQAEQLAAFVRSGGHGEGGARADRVADLCGTPCPEVVDASGTAVCAISWRDGCGDDAPPPDGFGADAPVAELCELSCAFYTMQQGAGGGAQSGA